MEADVIVWHLEIVPDLRGFAAANDLMARATTKCGLEPIQEVWIQRKRFDPVKRRNMMRTMARRINAATVLA